MLLHAVIAFPQFGISGTMNYERSFLRIIIQLQNQEKVSNFDTRNFSAVVSLISLLFAMQSPSAKFHEKLGQRVSRLVESVGGRVGVPPIQSAR